MAQIHLTLTHPYIHTYIHMHSYLTIFKTVMIQTLPPKWGGGTKQTNKPKQNRQKINKQTNTHPHKNIYLTSQVQNSHKGNKHWTIIFKLTQHHQSIISKKKVHSSDITNRYQNSTGESLILLTNILWKYIKLRIVF